MPSVSLDDAPQVSTMDSSTNGDEVGKIVLLKQLDRREGAEHYPHLGVWKAAGWVEAVL